MNKIAAWDLMFDAQIIIWLVKKWKGSCLFKDLASIFGFDRLDYFQVFFLSPIAEAEVKALACKRDKHIHICIYVYVLQIEIEIKKNSYK